MYNVHVVYAYYIFYILHICIGLESIAYGIAYSIAYDIDIHTVLFFLNQYILLFNLPFIVRSFITYGVALILELH